MHLFKSLILRTNCFIIYLFRQLSLYVWALLTNVCEETEPDAEKEEDLAKYALILSIFRKMKLAEDKIDATKTEVSLFCF